MAVETFRVVGYGAQIEPDIANKTVTGKVTIRLVALVDSLSAIELDCGDLTIDGVLENGSAQTFERRGRRLSISLLRSAKANESREIQVSYHGTPRFGIRFFPERDEVYTVFSTSQWMVCIDSPDEKATLHLHLILPDGLSSVSNGYLVGERHLPARTDYEWRQDTPVPSYTFGFAAGRFRTVAEQRGRLQLRYLTEGFSDAELGRIFKDTADMISFYEDRSGVQYNDQTYTQVLAAGGVEQEMSGFAVMRETYGKDVLADDHAIWLAAHELAHQWWGNMVTCRDWNHFWLNEGMATFMAAAYKEHRFGRPEYDREIERSRSRYQRVAEAGKDRSLVFPDWLHPTPDDRTLVYHKGAYVLHLLRRELGDALFWKGIRLYTRRYFGKSVITADFQAAMQEAGGKDLSVFFGEWVYRTEPKGTRP